MDEKARVRYQIGQLTRRLQDLETKEAEDEQLRQQRRPFREGETVLVLDVPEGEDPLLEGRWIKGRVVRVHDVKPPLVIEHFTPYDVAFDVTVSRRLRPGGGRRGGHSLSSSKKKGGKGDNGKQEEETGEEEFDMILNLPARRLRIPDERKEGKNAGEGKDRMNGMEVSLGDRAVRALTKREQNLGAGTIEVRRVLEKEYLRRLDTDAERARMVTTIAGGFRFGGHDGFHDFSTFECCNDVSVDPMSGDLFVVDVGSHKIKRVGPDGSVDLLAGGPSYGYRDGNGARARFFCPTGCAWDRMHKRLVVVERYNMMVRAVDVETGEVTSIAGRNGTYGHEDGVGSSALFCEPTHVTADVFGNIFITDYGNAFIRKIAPSREVTTVRGVNLADLDQARRIYGASVQDATLPRRSDFRHYFAVVPNPTGIAVGANGNIYVTTQHFNHAVMKVTPDYMVYTLAGDTRYQETGNKDGFGSNARFFQPSGLRYVARPPRSGGWGKDWKMGAGGGRLVLCDTYNNKVRMVDPRCGEVKSIAGLGSKVASWIDGMAMGPFQSDNEYLQQPIRADRSAQRAFFFFPSGLDLDYDGNIYVAESGNHAIRKINAYQSIATPVLMDIHVYIDATLHKEASKSNPLPTHVFGSADEDDELAVMFQQPATPIRGRRSLFWGGAAHTPALSQPPAIHWDYPSSYASVIVCFDPDHTEPAMRGNEAEPTRGGSRGPYLHWLVVGATKDVQSGTTIAEYQGPEDVDRFTTARGSRPRQGRHRIAFLHLMLTERNAKIQYFGGFDPRVPERTRERWNLARFVALNKLYPVSCNFYYYQYSDLLHDANAERKQLRSIRRTAASAKANDPSGTTVHTVYLKPGRLGRK